MFLCQYNKFYSIKSFKNRKIFVSKIIGKTNITCYGNARYYDIFD